MGVQSLNENLLDRLGRIHSREQVFKSFDILRAAGFENINVDLMFAIPGQTIEIWRKTLSEATALGSEHLSSYEVIYEEDTALYAQLKAKEFEVDEELACAMYEELVAHAAGTGFQQYEIANFARNKRETSSTEFPDYACRHNVNYWHAAVRFTDWGPSATGYVLACGRRKTGPTHSSIASNSSEASRRSNPAKGWRRGRGRGKSPAFGLRMNSGWPFEQFKKTTGWDLRHDWAGEMKQRWKHKVGDARSRIGFI